MPRRISNLPVRFSVDQIRRSTIDFVFFWNNKNVKLFVVETDRRTDSFSTFSFIWDNSRVFRSSLNERKKQFRVGKKSFRFDELGVKKNFVRRLDEIYRLK